MTTKSVGAAYHQAGHAVMAYLRDVNFEGVSILPRKHGVDCILECHYEASVPGELDWADAKSYVDTNRIEIGLAGPFAQGLYVGGFRPGKDATEMYIRATEAYLKSSENKATQYALARDVMNLNVSVGQNLMDEVISSPYPRIILFDVSIHWDLVEAVADALMERSSLSQAEVYQIIQARER